MVKYIIPTGVVIGSVVAFGALATLLMFVIGITIIGGIATGYRIMGRII